MPFHFCLPSQCGSGIKEENLDPTLKTQSREANRKSQKLFPCGKNNRKNMDGGTHIPLYINLNWL